MCAPSTQCCAATRRAPGYPTRPATRPGRRRPCRPSEQDARCEAHRRAPDGGLDPGLAARTARRRVPRGARPARARAASSTSAAASGSRPPGSAGPDRRVVGIDYDPETAVLAGADCGPGGPRGTDVEFAAMDGAAARLPDRRRSTAVCSSHIIEHFIGPEQHVAELARVSHRRRHHVRDHAEPAGRLREPVPRVPVRGRRARVDAAAVLRRRRGHRPRGRRRAQGRLRGPAHERRASS